MQFPGHETVLIGNRVRVNEAQDFEWSILTMTHEHDHFKVPLLHTEVTSLHGVIKVYNYMLTRLYLPNWCFLAKRHSTA